MTGSTKRNKPYLVGVAGGSGSGKTYFAEALARELGSALCHIVYQDNFYVDQSKRFDYDGGSVNFDHPDAIDAALLAERMAKLKQGQAVDIPIYDFVTHSRRAETIRVDPAPVIIVDGILIFHWEPVRSLFDDLVYFDTPEDLRFLRRMERDVLHRGRTPEGVKSQFYKQVKPMHDQFVEPSKRFASTVVCEVDEYERVLSNYCQKLRSL